MLVVADAVASRTDANWQNGLDLCERAGALITNTETVVFDLLTKAGYEVVSCDISMVGSYP